ncbi:MAG: magnesium-translocating P-type ATPase [Patescibacteria group bacterium]|nr:magnesium-translocating P-type ATPase [Patescibacteria group bacterium]
MVNPASWSRPTELLLKELGTSADGLKKIEAKKRLEKDGLNEIRQESSRPVLRILWLQLQNWLIIILFLAAAVSYFLGEHLEGGVITSLVLLSVFFGFFQEYRAEKALEKLRKYISHKIRVKRDGQWQTLENKELVVGDLVELRIGDIVPADIRLISLDGLAVNESVLTGESEPVVKDLKTVSKKRSQPQDLKNMVFMGTSVSLGLATGVVTAVAKDTFFGKTAKLLSAIPRETDFQKQIKNFGSFLFKVTVIMTTFVFLANAFLEKGIFESLLFAVALAVGIAPEMLPAVITVTLSQGALKMARQKVIVKRLASVEDLGNVDTLCTDKTGTLTEGKFSLAGFKNVNGDDLDQESLRLALLCTGGFNHQRKVVPTNATDKALWESGIAGKLKKSLASYRVLDENEFDFERKRMSVLVAKKERSENYCLVVKGAPESVLAAVSEVIVKGESVLIKKQKREEIAKQLAGYESLGYRVIALARKKMKEADSVIKDENNLTLLGFLLFSDPVKASAAKSLELFQKLGVKIKIISGDSIGITKSIAVKVGLIGQTEKIISGEDLARLHDRDFDQCVNQCRVFARVTPEQKYKIVASLNREGHIVGFLGDGINDAPALKAADVGIAVDTGAAISKEAADIILLKKDLQILAEGIGAGRKTFGNIMKYILNTISANYGNMFTVSASSLFLKFIPLLPSQILLNNFISDIPLLAIATDNVDGEFVKKPKRWNIRLIGMFMLYFGLISSFFDFVLILFLLLFWKVGPGVFRTAWFIESSLSEIMVTFSIRTKLLFFRSKPSRWLIVLSFFSSLLVVLMPFLAFGREVFEFSLLPVSVWIWIALVVVSYFIVTEMVKHKFFAKFEF